MGVATKIGELAKKRGVSLKELSREIDIPYTTLYHAVKRDSKMEFETVKKIAAALGVSWYEFYPGDANDREVKAWESNITDDYRERLDSAAAYLTELKTTAMCDSDTDWTADEQNSWMKKKLPEIAQKFNVSTEKLDEAVYWNYPEEEHWISDIQEAIDQFNYSHNDQISFKSVKEICCTLTQLSEEGQREAAKRVQELAQIPAYQRPTAPAQSAPGAPADKDPAEK